MLIGSFWPLQGETVLHRRCQEAGNETEIRKLIAGGHEVDCTDYSKFTPLHEACNYGHLSYVKAGGIFLWSAKRGVIYGIFQLLVESGANVNKQASQGITPLIDAASNMEIPIVELLLDYGKSPDISKRREQFEFPLRCQDTGSR